MTSLDDADIQRLIEQHLPLVRHVVFQVAVHFPRHIDREELATAGALGLVEAARRYDEARGVPFDRFAAQRISSGHNPFDAWYPYFGLGAPQFTQYQTLSHIITGLLSIVFGGWVFRGTNYLLLCTFPISAWKATPGNDASISRSR